MRTKMIEIRDKGTFIPAIAVELTSTLEQEEYLLRRGGFKGVRCILLTRIEGGKSNYDPYSWNDRTWQVTHLHLENNWDDINTGDVVDVEFVLGETSEPKLSERHGS